MSTGDIVVFAGALVTQTRKQAADEAERHGFTVSDSITRATSFLVYGDKIGAKKVADAAKLGVEVFTDDEWRAKLLASPSPPAQAATGTATKGGAGSKKRKADAKPSAGDSTTSTATCGLEPASEVVVFTGALVTQSRKDATRAVEALGFRVQPKLTKVTTILVYGDRAGQKLDDAKKLGVAVLSEDEWEQKLTAAAGVSATDPPAKRLATHALAASDSGDSDDAVYDEATAAINRVRPKRLLPDGTFHDVQSASSSATYLVKRLGSTYTCSCPAWRNQRHAPTSRTCKHLKDVLGDEYEAVRTNTGNKSNAASETTTATATTRAKKSKVAAPNVLLAHKWEREKHDPVGWWISEKLDGVRAYWAAKQRVFLSRNGNVYPAPAWFTAGFPVDVDLDGELFGGRGRFQFTVGVAKTDGSKHWTELVYKVFDAPSLPNKTTFEDRMATAHTLATRTGSKYLEWVEHTKCTSLAHLDEVFATVEALGGEGLMIREPGSVYCASRSSSLLKIKSFHDGDAVVIAHEAGKGKYAGLTGALRCRMASGKEFKCASGLSDAQRAKPPAVGSVIVYKCQELTNDGVPRFPTFLGVAADKTGASDPVIANAGSRD